MADQTIGVAAHITAKKGHERDLETVLLGLIEPTRAELGCILYELYRDEKEPARFTFLEKWESKAALDKHMASAHFQEAGKKMEAFLGEAPDIRISYLIN